MISVVDLLNLVILLCKDVDFPAPCNDFYIRCAETHFDRNVRTYSPEVRKCFIIPRHGNIDSDKKTK
jgi:hypothetical protein